METKTSVSAGTVQVAKQRLIELAHLLRRYGEDCKKDACGDCGVGYFCNHGLTPETAAEAIKHYLSCSVSADYLVDEICPHCEREIELRWDVKELGYKATCPVCGGRLMLCDECLHAEDNEGGRCDYDSKTDTCYRRKEKVKLVGMCEKTHDIDQEDEFVYLQNYVEQSSFDEDICRDRLRMLWTAYCLHHNLDVDTAEYDNSLLALWNKIEEIGDGTSEWDGYDGFDSFMCKYLV